MSFLSDSFFFFFFFLFSELDEGTHDNTTITTTRKALPLKQIARTKATKKLLNTFWLNYISYVCLWGRKSSGNAILQQIYLQIKKRKQQQQQQKQQQHQ